MKMRYAFAALAILFLVGCGAQEQAVRVELEPVKIGWISDLSGPSAKWGALEAAMIAVDEVNDDGGIGGRKLELIPEDGNCNAKAATLAMNKLVNINKLKIILGGHCSPESLAIVPIAKENNILLLASLTTSPDFSNSGDLIFRTSPVSTAQSSIVAKHMREDLGFNKIAILYEDTVGAQPIAEVLSEEFQRLGGTVALYEAFGTDQRDYRSILTKIKHAAPNAIYISPQDHTKVALILKQMEELNIELKIFGNELLSNVDLIRDNAKRMEGVIFAQPRYDPEDKTEKVFVKKYNERYGTTALPLGIYTAENYDAVMIITDALRKHGEDVDAIARYLENVKDYDGVSGLFSINKKHDGDREYILKQVKNGKTVAYDTN